MKKYALFSGDIYYPNRGANDFIGRFDTIEEAKLYIEIDKSFDAQFEDKWAHVSISDTMVVISELKRTGIKSYSWIKPDVDLPVLADSLAEFTAGRVAKT